MPTASKQTKLPENKVKTPKKALPKAAPDDFIGRRAAAFALPATVLGKASSASLKNKPYILYFYPKDDTSGCTAEACAFRDMLPDFSKLGVTVLGVSKDSLESHEKFAKKYELTFPLISDKDGDLCEKYGVWKQKSMYGRTYMGIERSTFLIDSEGVVRAVWRKVSVPGHADEVKQALSEL